MKIQHFYIDNNIKTNINEFKRLTNSNFFEFFPSSSYKFQMILRMFIYFEYIQLT